MDSYGRWKALQYNVKKAYKDVIISSHRDKGNIEIYAVSDKYENIPVKARFRLMNFNGRVIRSEEKKLTLPANTSTSIHKIIENEWLRPKDTVSTFLHISLFEDDKELCQNTIFFAKPKNVVLPKAEILIKKIDRNHVSVYSDKLARFVWLYLPESINAFSDNYFDLLPGEIKILKVNEHFSLKDIQVKSLADMK